MAKKIKAPFFPSKRFNPCSKEQGFMKYYADEEKGKLAFHISDYKGRVGKYSKHRLQTGWDVTRRSAAVHWGEGNTPSGYYLVQGWHWEGINGVGEVLRATTSVDNCSIYDGWWEL